MNRKFQEEPAFDKRSYSDSDSRHTFHPTKYQKSFLSWPQTIVYDNYPNSPARSSATINILLLLVLYYEDFSGEVYSDQILRSNTLALNAGQGLEFKNNFFMRLDLHPGVTLTKLELLSVTRVRDQSFKVSVGYHFSLFAGKLLANSPDSFLVLPFQDAMTLRFRKELSAAHCSLLTADCSLLCIGREESATKLDAINLSESTGLMTIGDFSSK